MFRKQKGTGVPGPRRSIAPPSIERGGLLYCPMSNALCMGDCAWYTSGGCAVAVLAQQAARQGNELYAIVEAMQGNSVGAAPPEGEQDRGGGEP